MLNWIILIIALGVGAGGGGVSIADDHPSETEATTELVAEPQAPSGKFTTATEVKPILTTTRGNWVAVRAFNGQDLVYVTQIWAWRCGLLRLEIAVNGGPAEVWPLPECHADTATPNAITEADGLPYRAFPAGSVETVSVKITYDDLSTVDATYERAAILVP